LFAIPTLIAFKKAMEDKIVCLKKKSRRNKDTLVNGFIYINGLPYMGQIIQSRDPYCSVINTVTQEQSGA
jgi:hypothetical protein